MAKGYWNKDTISKLARETGLNYSTIYRRINILKWDKEIAASTPLTTSRAYKKILRKLNK